MVGEQNTQKEQQNTSQNTTFLPVLQISTLGQFSVTFPRMWASLDTYGVESGDKEGKWLEAEQ